MRLHNRLSEAERPGAVRAGAAGRRGATSTTTLSTDGVDPAGRFDFWRQVLSAHFGGTELRPAADDQAPFRARLVAVELGEVTLCRVAGSAAEVVRPAPIQDPGPGSTRFHLEIPLRGTAHLAQAGREATLAPGDFALCDNALPFRYAFSSSFYDELVIQVPRARLLALEPRADQLTAIAVRGGDGLGSLLALMLRKAADLDAWSASPVASLFVAQLVELLVTALGGELGPSERSPARSRYLAQAKAYLQEHLCEPDLAPDRVARAVGISPRYLHALFQGEGTTVARYLTDRRLEHARLLLSSRRHDAESVTEIATAVGFRSLSHFSSVFKAATDGVSPRAFREASRGR